MAWVFDAPSGVYKNHALSSNIRREAAADSIFMPFVRPEDGFGKGKGESVDITRVEQLPLAGKVSETDRLPSVRPAITTKRITVSEWGNKIEMTNFEENLTHFDLRNQFQMMLRDQMKLTMDKMIADAFKTTPYLFIPVAAGSVFDTDGDPSTQADANLDVDDLRTIYDELKGTLKVPPFRNGNYIGILTTKAARGIKNDSEFKDWLAPTSALPFKSPGLKFVKEIEGFQLFETNHFNALSNGKGAASILGEALFFGSDPVSLVTVEDPELRAGIPEDLGRFRDVGWVGTLDAGLIWDTAALSRVIYVTSS